MVNPKCTPAQIARNLIARRDQAYEAMQIAIRACPGFSDSSPVVFEAYIAAKKAWQTACQDVRDFKAAHPSAFDFEEVAE